MDPKILKLIYQPIVNQAAIRSLVGRSRERNQPAKGRFTAADVKSILASVWKKYDLLAPQVPNQSTLGNQMNLLLSCVTVSCFQAMSEIKIERSYAIELIGDTAWKVYERWGLIPILIGRLQSRDPRQQMKSAVSLFLHFPFSPPGYIFDLLPSETGVSINMRKCMVAEYFRQQNASDLCVSTWCNLDFALAEMWGGWLERTETLAAGDPRCDFRFKTPVTK